ncbi:MAG: single-stranded-DNA-specific exonuclease RecJ, partial [Pseudanabaena sp.]
IAKYLSRTGKEIKRSQLIAKLGIDDQRVLQMGFDALQKYGYILNFANDEFDNLEQIIRISLISLTDDCLPNSSLLTQQFIQSANEIIFQQRFFNCQFC